MESSEKKNILNLNQLHDYFSYGSGPDTMANYIDILLFEHMRLILMMMERGIGLRTMEIHSDTAEIVRSLRVLRDLLDGCVVKIEE